MILSADGHFVGRFFVVSPFTQRPRIIKSILQVRANLRIKSPSLITQLRQLLKRTHSHRSLIRTPYRQTQKGIRARKIFHLRFQIRTFTVIFASGAHSASVGFDSSDHLPLHFHVIYISIRNRSYTQKLHNCLFPQPACVEWVGGPRA